MNPGMEPTALPPEDESLIAPARGPNAQVGLSLEQVNAAVAASEIAFTVQTPGYLPEGFAYSDGIVHTFGRMIILNYFCSDRLTSLSLIMGDLTNPADVRWEQPVGADAEVVAVQVGGTNAEYVR